MKWLLFFFPIFLASQDLYIGPDIFYRNYREKAKNGRKSKDLGWLYGFQAGYDLIQCSIPYISADLRYAEGRTEYIGAIQNLRTGVVTPLYSHTDNNLFNIEVRAGYPFFLGRWRLIPFLGMGYQRWYRDALDKKTGYTEVYRWAYFAEGLRISLELPCHWETGLHLKLMQMKMAEIEIRGFFPWTSTLSLGDKLQAEIELPLTYSFNHFFLNLTPYFRFLPIGKSQIQKTPKGVFFEPASNTNVYGLRLEAAILF